MNAAEFSEIENAVRESERLTEAEWVVSVQKSSSDYGWVHWVWGGVSSLMASVILMMATRNSGWTARVSDLIEWQCVGFFLGTLVPYHPWIKRWSIPKAWASDAVRRGAMVEFVQSGLASTKNRTGILIFVSLIERRVEILVDQGIHSEFSSEYWKTHADAISNGFKSGSAKSAICDVIRQTTPALARRFPVDPHRNPNELSDQIRT